MKIIVIGAGRLGLGVFWQLRAQHHQVTMIEADSNKAKLLQKQAPDALVVGPLFAQTTLETAGIATCDALVACTPDDEVNAVLARVAKQTYRVPKVIARLYDPLKADIYSALGIQALATTLWGVERVLELVTYSHLDSVYELNHGDVRLVRITIPVFWWGKAIQNLNYNQEIQVVAIQRENRAFIPQPTEVFSPHDFVYLTVTNFATERLQTMLGLKEE